MSYARTRRWSDNDRHFGPLTFAYTKAYRPFGVVLDSGKTSGCHIRFSAFGGTMICELPAIIKPWQRWVDLSRETWANGSKGYWDIHPREYGFSLSDGFLHVKLGAQTGDSTTTQDWAWFLPWKQWRVISNRIYNADGSLAGDVAKMSWQDRSKLMDTVTKKSFAIIDFDEERIGVETFASEMDWRLGEGWFRWLGYIVPKKKRRSLDISFKSEVGPEKGSWKGGTLGHGIDMLPGESQEQAFHRYCDQEHRSKYRKFRITFVDAA